MWYYYLLLFLFAFYTLHNLHCLQPQLRLLNPDSQHAPNDNDKTRKDPKTDHHSALPFKKPLALEGVIEHRRGLLRPSMRPGFRCSSSSSATVDAMEAQTLVILAPQKTLCWLKMGFLLGSTLAGCLRLLPRL